MASTSTFSTSGEDVMSRLLLLEPAQTPTPCTANFETFYAIARTARQIEEWDCHRIALQFPDELLHDSVPIYHALKARLGTTRDLYILADTSYGSCCVDEVAASHVDADVSVHYGHTCLSQTSRLPVINVFGEKELDVELCVTKLVDHLRLQTSEPEKSQTIIVKHDVGYTHRAEEIVQSLRDRLGTSWDVVYEHIPLTYTPKVANSKQSVPTKLLVVESHRGFVMDLETNSSHNLCNESSLAPTDDTASNNASIAKSSMVWIGDESPTLTKLLMISGGRDVIGYSPSNGSLQLQSQRTNKLLMRRYALVQKARDADVFGILVGTLGVASYLPLLSHLRGALKRARKKSYTVSVGKLNPSKLANFMEIECWVWVSCSEGMIDSKDFSKPIITPYELELALQVEPSWSGNYVFNFDELLSGEFETDGDGSGMARNDADADQPLFSLVTGKYRSAKRYGDDVLSKSERDSTTALTQNNQNSALSKLGDNAAAHFLQSRTYQGLEQRLGEDEPSILEQGRTGIARGYKDDHV